MARQIAVGVDDFSSRLLKLIPSEVSAAFLAINSLVPMDRGFGPEILVTLGVLTILTPLYLYRLQNVTNKLQLAYTSVAFPIWGANISSARLDAWSVDPIWLGILLILFTSLGPLLVGRER